MRLFNCGPFHNAFGKKIRCSFDNGAYRFPLLNAAFGLFISGLSGRAFISKIKIEENEIMCQFKTMRYFLNYVV